MKSIKQYDDLEKERRKLIRLIENTVEKGIPITQNEEILAQSRKVDILILGMPLMKNQRRKKRL